MAEALRLLIPLPALASMVHEVPRPAGLSELAGAVCDFASAMVLGVVLAAFAARRRVDTIAYLWLALAVVVVLQFIVGPLVEPWRGYFGALSATGWITGAVAFVVALARGAPGLTAAPLLLAIVAVVVPILQVGLDSPLQFPAHGAGVAAIAGMYGFMGMLLRRSLEAALDTQQHRAGALDVGRLANFVSRLDTSATLRSFGALLVVLGVGVALFGTGIGLIIVQSFTDPDSLDGKEIALAWALFVPLTISPLLFIVFDAMDRQDRLRPISALSGAALAGGGLAAAAALLGAFLFLPELLPDESSLALPVIGAAAVIAGTLLAIQLFARSRRVRIVAGLLLVLSALAVVALVAVATMREEASQIPLAIAALLTAIASLVLVARSVRLRADLSGDVPRRLLFGEIHGGGFWARLAGLMGMPASMWNRAALRMPAFWTLLLARPLVYAGAAGMWNGYLLAGSAGLIAGHAVFEGGKRLAARSIWRASDKDSSAPVLFLRSFEDDQFDLGGRSRNPWRRWLELWSFRRNLDEMLVDEAAQYGAVVALGRPGETRVPFGAARYYSTHDDWQRIITETARRAHSIVVVAGDTPGVRWEYELLAREGLLERTVLLFRPGREAQAANRAALAAFPLDDEQRAKLAGDAEAPLVALLHLNGKQVLLSAADPDPAAYVLALRSHFQRCDAVTLTRAAHSAPPRLELRAPFAAG